MSKFVSSSNLFHMQLTKFVNDQPKTLNVFKTFS